MTILLVGIGGALGSIARYLLGVWIQFISKDSGFPYGILAVNLMGCFLIGFLSQLADTHAIFTVEARAFVFIGILGGFTTFSSFGNDTINLLRSGDIFNAFVNIAANLILGLGLVFFGRALAYRIW